MTLQATLKVEISRLARKEVRKETASLQAAVTRYRSDIAALKREMVSLERQLRTLGRHAGKAQAPESADEGSALRFSAKGLATHRARLGLTAEAFGQLVGVTGQSIYKWEAGKARPRASQLPAIAKIRAMSKKEAGAMLEHLEQLAR